MTPLGYASYEGHTDIVELLLEKGADVNALNQVICFFTSQMYMLCCNACAFFWQLNKINNVVYKFLIAAHFNFTFTGW